MEVGSANRLPSCPGHLFDMADSGPAVTVKVGTDWAIQNQTAESARQFRAVEPCGQGLGDVHIL